MKKAYGWIIALILLSFVMAGVFVTIGPDQIPVHYDIQGNIDRWGSKYEFLLFPILTAFFGGFMALVGKFSGKKGEQMNEKIVAIMTVWILIVFNGMWLFFMWKAFQGGNLYGDPWDLAAKGFLALLMASFIPVGNLMPKVQRNGALGLRTKWSMADDVCWQKSQRFGGFCMVAAGIVGVAAVSVAPASWGGFIVLALMLIMTVGCVIGSYWIYQKEHK